jgi:hypothetical protein
VIRRVVFGTLVGIVAGFAVGLLPVAYNLPWLSRQPWWPVGDALTLPLAWTPCGLLGGAVGAVCSWADHRRGAREKKP